MPMDYPKNPPKGTFKTRMWHPNVEESTGAVCLETLKRDWDPKLTLKDILLACADRITLSKFPG
jgi:ubiquitin-conjugating enzyme E2 S